MSYLEEIKEQIKTASTVCTHSNDAAGWFTRVDEKDGFCIYYYDVNGDLTYKRYKNINTFAKAVMNKINVG